MRPERRAIRQWKASLGEEDRDRLRRAIEKIASAKERGGRVVVVTGSGPNLHEGVTTMLAGMIRQGLIDGVITSAAVVAHEMAGALDRVKRVRVADGCNLPLDRSMLPRGGVFEITLLDERQRAEIQQEMQDGWDLYDRILASPGDVILKAAGNLAWPIGLRTEALAREAEPAARREGVALEALAGRGADPNTMIGAAWERGVPVVVSVPQLVGGGDVGLAIGDAIPISRRARLVADLLASADVVIESAIALSQEIHDGPFELYTGHGIWAAWRGIPAFSLASKTLIRIDLDRNLELAWKQERECSRVTQALEAGLPKTKTTGIPFRMEMSGFARLESSIPITADIGIAWPCIAAGLEDALGVRLDFISAPQESPEGRRMREWIAAEVRYADRRKILRDGTA